LKQEERTGQKSGVVSSGSITSGLEETGKARKLRGEWRDNVGEETELLRDK
jgi:hypothetical protein